MRPTSDLEAHNLLAAGWKPKERCGKLIWKHPDNGFYYSQEMAAHFLGRKVLTLGAKAGQTEVGNTTGVYPERSKSAAALITHACKLAKVDGWLVREYDVAYKNTKEGRSAVKIELGYATFEGCWQECALCGMGFRAYEVEARTELPGEYCLRPVCRGCWLAGEAGLKQKLHYRAWELRDLAERLERACEEGIEVPSLEELHNLERIRVNRVPTDLSDFDGF